MKTIRILALAAVAAIAALPAHAQCTLNKDTCANFTFSAPGSQPGAYYPIPNGTTTINAQIASDAVTGSYTAQIETAASISGGALVSPSNCGASVTVGTTAGTVTASCTASSTQPWSYVAVVLTGGTGSGHGTISFLSSLVGRSPTQTEQMQPVSIAVGPWAGTGGSPSVTCDTGDGYTCNAGAGVLLVQEGTTGGSTNTTVATLSWSNPFVASPLCTGWFAFNTLSNTGWAQTPVYPDGQGTSKTSIALNAQGNAIASMKYLVAYRCCDAASGSC